MPYIGKSPTGTGGRSRYYFTATAGATSLSGADDNSNTLVFSDGNYVDVSLNGIALVAGTDYNTSTANTIAGLSALSAGDIVEVVVYDIFTVADTVSAKDGGTFSGGITVSGAITATSFTGDGSGLTGVSAGKVLQVKQTSIAAIASQVAQGESTFADISGATISITPSSSSNKILVSYTLHIGNSTTSQNNVIKLLRDSTAIVGTGGSSINVTGYARLNNNTEIQPEAIQYLDSPATTSAITYKLQWATGSGTIYLNRRGYNDTYGVLSTITVMEIAA